MKRMLLVAAAAAAVTAAPWLAPSVSAQGTDQFIGQLMVVPYTYCPLGWTETNGQLLAISQNTALFSLLGCTYGGDCQTTFGLPDLRGRVAVHVGTGNSLPPVQLGEVFGQESTTLTLGQLPMHTHALLASSGNPDDPTPNNALLGTFPPTGAKIYSLDAADTTMNGQAIGPAGNSQPFDQEQPSLGLRYCIALEGIYPSRN